MAEIGEIAEEAIAEAEEGIEELPEEVQEEIEAEINETRTAVEELSTSEREFQCFFESECFCEASIAKFVGKNIAIGVILWGVNAVIHKVAEALSKDTQNKMRNVIKALSDVINAESAISKKILDWIKVHKDDTINLDGIELPMESILIKYIKPLAEAVDKTETIAKSLQEKVDGKTQFKCPTADNMRDFMGVIEVFIKAFSDLLEFILKTEEKVEVLQSFPVKLDVIIDLTAKLNVVKALPLW